MWQYWRPIFGWENLCPIYFADPLGILLIMPRAKQPITFEDVILLAQHFYFGDEVKADPDVNSDGSVTFDDVILLAQHFYFGDPIYP